MQKKIVKRIRLPEKFLFRGFLQLLLFYFILAMTQTKKTLFIYFFFFL